jgi:hypothetical protein
MNKDYYLDGVYVHTTEGGLDYGYNGTEMVYPKIEYYRFHKDKRIDYHRTTRTGAYDYVGTYEILGAQIRFDWFGKLEAKTESFTYSPDGSILIIGGREYKKSQPGGFPKSNRQGALEVEIMAMDKIVLGDYSISMDLQNLYVTSAGKSGKAGVEETYFLFDLQSKTWIRLQDKRKRGLPISVFKEGMTLKVRLIEEG